MARHSAVITKKSTSRLNKHGKSSFILIVDIFILHISNKFKTKLTEKFLKQNLKFYTDTQKSNHLPIPSN